MSSTTDHHDAKKSVGITALILFFLFGALMSGLTAVMLIAPGSRLDAIWRLNLRAQGQFHKLGIWAVLMMALVCLACALAALGLRRRKAYGFRAAVVILSINLAGDLANAVLAHDWRTLIGLPIGGMMLIYLYRKRRSFA